MTFTNCLNTNPNNVLYDVTFKSVTAGIIIPSPTPLADGILISQSGIINEIPDGNPGYILVTDGNNNPTWQTLAPPIIPSEGIQYSDGVFLSSIATGTVNQVLVSNGTNPIWANPTIGVVDIVANSIQVNDGTALLPTIKFTGDPNCGFYYDANANSINTTINGVEKTGFDDNGIRMINNLYPGYIIPGKLNTYTDSEGFINVLQWKDTENLANVVNSSLKIIRVGDVVTIMFRAIPDTVWNLTNGASFLVLDNFTVPIGYRPDADTTMYFNIPSISFNNAPAPSSDMYGMIYDGPTNKFYIANFSTNDNGFNKNGQSVSLPKFCITYLV